MRILVTGGAGFIGSHLVKFLLTKGHTVGVLDSRQEWDAWKNVTHGSYIDRTQQTRLYPMDCRDLPGQVIAKDWDYCYHLASTVGVNRVLADPRECIENIIESTRAVLRLGLPGMYFSTSEVYGKQVGLLQEDSDCVISPKARWTYAGAKLCGEWLSLAEGWKVVRLFNVIGPNQSLAYGAVVPRFIDAARQGLAIPVYGDGQQKRTFTSVHDVVQILDMLRDAAFRVTNVGSENTVTINELARLVRQTCGSTSQIVSVPYSAAYAHGFEECPERVPDLFRLRHLIGDFKFRSLESSIKEITNVQQQRYDRREQDCETAVSGL